MVILPRWTSPDHQDSLHNLEVAPRASETRSEAETCSDPRHRHRCLPRPRHPTTATAQGRHPPVGSHDFALRHRPRRLVIERSASRIAAAARLSIIELQHDLGQLVLIHGAQPSDIRSDAPELSIAKSLLRSCAAPVPIRVQHEAGIGQDLRLAPIWSSRQKPLTCMGCRLSIGSGGGTRTLNFRINRPPPPPHRAGRDAFRHKGFIGLTLASERARTTIGPSTCWRGSVRGQRAPGG